MSRLYWDCFSGIAGNMAVASLLDAGADKERVLAVLDSIPFPEGKVQIVLETKETYGIRGLYFNTLDDHQKDIDIIEKNESELKEQANYAVDYTSQHSTMHGCKHCDEISDSNLHSMSHSIYHTTSHTNSHTTSHTNSQPHLNTHNHQCHQHIHDHTHSHHSNYHTNSTNYSNLHTHDFDDSNLSHTLHFHCHTHNHVHRGVKEIKELLAKSSLSESEFDLAMSIFNALAQAEAEVHNVSVDDIHFHEVGARDSITDIVAISCCIHSLGITSVHVSDINVGSGFVRCEHGILPVPSPATAILLKGYKITNQPLAKTELTTPTGAAILKALGAKCGMPVGFVYSKLGHGIGSKDIGFCNILRAFVEENVSGSYTLEHDEIVYFETNLDNVSGEILGFVVEKLVSEGALDVAIIPTITKKNRPAYILTAMAKVSDEQKIETVIFRELPTLGLRKQRLIRSKLFREKTKIDTEFGELDAKIIRLIDGKLKLVVEYDAIKGVAEKQKISLREAEERIYNELRNRNFK